MLNRFLKANRGVAAIEFAILLPFLLIVFYGVYQISTYVMAVRKVDNVANDIAYILSREGTISDNINGPTYTGGATKLNRTYQNVLPFLMFPYKYDPVNNNDSQIQAQFVGLPQFTACPGVSDGIDRTSLRLMWSHKFPDSSTTTVTTTGNATDLCSDSANSASSSLCPDVCGLPARGKYYSIFKDSFGQRAIMIYPGQSFILVNFAYNFDAILPNSFPGIGFILDKKIEKIASYAVRSRWIDGGDGVVQSNELRNNMQYCTDCNTFRSGYNTTGGLTVGGSTIRQVCRPVASLTAGNSMNSGGCDFY